MPSARSLRLAAAILPLLTSVSDARLTPAQVCEATKLRAQAAFSSCRLTADAANAKKPSPSKRDAVYAKCATALAGAYAKAEAKAVKAGGSCPTSGDDAAIRDLLGQCTLESRQTTVGEPCSGIGCAVAECPLDHATTLKGTVYAPNGTLPVPNAIVYVPNGPVGALPAGVTCDRCASLLGGTALARTITNAAGEFVLRGVPAAPNVPLVIQIGKWRRQLVVPSVPACTDTQLAADQTRLPRTRDEGDIPLIAVSTGGADSLECLLRKLGIADTEFSTSPGLGHVHLFAGSGGTDQFDPGVGGGAQFAASTSLWSSLGSLEAYDVVLLSCEGAQNPGTKPGAALQAMKDYADRGGRVYLEHWHNYWLQAGPTPWSSIVAFNFLPDLGNVTADVDTQPGRNATFADWLVGVQASTTRGKIAIVDAQHTATAVDASVAERVIYKDVTTNGQPTVQYASFTTPVEQPAAERCGRVVFSDLHQSSGDQSLDTLTFPSGGCISDVTHLSPQEKVLAYMVFDVGSCVGPISP